VRNKFFSRIISLFFFFCGLFITQVSAQEQSIDEFILQVQKDLESHDIPAYLEAFVPALREAEKVALEDKVNISEIDKITFHRASKDVQKKDRVTAYFQVLYENDYSAMIETWRLFLSQMDKEWQIEKKDVVGELKSLYKIKIPSDRVERVRSFKVRHVDIELSFEEASLFYDNIPGLETALIVIGKGFLTFSPSIPREQHQLQLIYKSKVLQESLEYAYLRFSDDFFHNNIKITKASIQDSRPVSKPEIDKARSIFDRHYARSLAIENSLNKELLSFVPQDEQAIFEFKGEDIDPLTYIYSPFAEDKVTLINIKKEKLISLYSPQEEAKKKLFISFGQKYDIKRYQIDIDFNPKMSYLSGKASIEISSKVGRLDSIKFKLNSQLQILRIFDEKKNELFYAQDKLRKFLYVYLVQHPSPQDSYRIEIFYRGRLKLPEQTTDVIAQTEIIRNKIEVPQRYRTYLFSQLAYWYPAPSDTDYFEARLKIIIPPEYACVATGELKEFGRLEEVERVEEIEKVGNSVYVFETAYPVKYLAFIVGKFSKVIEDSESFPVDIFASSNWGFQEKEVLERAKDILDFYQDRYGPNPYGKLSIVQRYWTQSGGHSPPSFIILDEFPRLPTGRKYRERESPVNLSRWDEYYLAHEIAHQWWGQGVTWESYHDQWLSEGLAQFSTILYIREKRGEGIFSHILRKFNSWTKKKSNWGPIILGSRLSHSDFDAFQTIVYNKTSLILCMLMEILGEEVFFRGLREFFHDHKYSAARTRDFIDTMERVSGKDLKMFFDGWFNSHLLPEIKATHTVQKNEDGYLLKFKFIQRQGPFVFPLWLEWREKGQKVAQKVIIKEVTEDYEFQLKEKPEKIKLNPHNAFPGKFS